MREMFSLALTEEEFNLLQSVWQSIRQASWARQSGDQWSNIKFYGVDMNDDINAIERVLSDTARHDSTTIILTRPLFNVFQGLWVKYYQECAANVGTGEQEEFALVSSIMAKVTACGENPIIIAD
jgi:hypothetical protein